MKHTTITGAIFFSLLTINNANAIDVVYSLSGLSNCKDVGEYRTNVKKKATKERVEKKLMSEGEKDSATHVYVNEYIDERGSGKGIKAIATGKRCD